MIKRSYLLVRVDIIAGIKQEERERTLELLNSMTADESFAAIGGILEKANIKEGPFTFWRDRLAERVGNLRSLGDYFTGDVPSLSSSR